MIANRRQSAQSGDSSRTSPDLPPSSRRGSRLSAQQEQAGEAEQPQLDLAVRRGEARLSAGSDQHNLVTASTGVEAGRAAERWRRVLGLSRAVGRLAVLGRQGQARREGNQENTDQHQQQ